MDYLTIPETCRTLRISRATVYRLLRAGTLTRLKSGNGAVFVTKDSIKAYRESLIPVVR